MLNSVHERDLCELPTTSVSFWSYVTANRQNWLNPVYERPPPRSLGDTNGLTELARRGRMGGSVFAAAGSAGAPAPGMRRWCPGLVLRPSHAVRTLRLWSELYLAWDAEVCAYTRSVAAALALARGAAAAADAARAPPRPRRSTTGPGPRGPTESLDAAEACTACGKRLGWMHRRRECSACHHSFCHKCAQHRRVVDGVAAKDGGLLVRVCEACSIASDRGTLVRSAGGTT